jgi:glycerol kinase
VDNLLMQFQADVAGVPIVRPKIHETTALGAAYLAGLAVAFWKDLGEIEHQWQKDAEFKPNLSGDKVKALKQGWNKAVGRAKGWTSEP